MISAGIATGLYAQTGPAGAAKDDRDPIQVKLLGSPRFVNAPKDVAIARMLLSVKNGSLSPEGFFKGLGNTGGNMKDVIRVKTSLNNEGLGSEFLGEHYGEGGTRVEEKLLSWRRAQTEAAIKDVIKGRSSNSSVFVAYVGSWVGQPSTALKFEGDIDFSFVSRDTNIISALKSAFEAKLMERTGLSSQAIDSVCTAHGKAGLEVYIGQHGAEFALSQMKIVDEILFSEEGLRRLSEDSAAGTVRGALGEAIDRVVRESEFQTSDPRIASSKYNAEPGLSMENLRHFYSDIVKEGIYSPVDTVIKAAKYVDRSNNALMKYLGIGSSDPGLSALSGELDKLKKESKVKQMDQKIRAYFQEKYGAMPFSRFEITTSNTGGPWLVTRPNKEIINRFNEDCVSAMWKNVETGYGKRIDDIKKQLDRLSELEGNESTKEQAKQLEDKLSKEIDDLEKMADTEMGVLRDAGLTHEGVAKLHEDFKSLAGEFRQGRGKATPDMLKDKQYLKAQFEAKTKLGRMLGIAYLMNKIEKGLDLGDKGISSINFYLDILDDKLLGELRGDNPDFDRFVTEYKETKTLKDSRSKSSALKGLKGTVANGIQQVNRKCNEAIQSTAVGRGAVKGLIAIGLIEEGAAYRDAYLKGGWGELATEFFRRRVPFGSSVEQAIMGNYLEAGWEVVTTLVPPLGLAQAAYGIGRYVLIDMPVTFYWTEQLNVFVDTLYATATFKLIGVESYESAKIGTWRLISAKYSGGVLNVEQFSRYKKEQVEAMRQQLKKGLSQRDMSLKAYYTLTDRAFINEMLKKNIAATDPALNLIQQMMSNEYVGSRLLQHYGDIYTMRWEEAKLNFVLNMIHQLEDRKAIDDALLRGMLPELFAELNKIAKELKIDAALEKEMDKELDTNNLKSVFRWLWNVKRDLLSEGQMESDYTKAGEIVKKYLDAYKIVYEARQESEAIFAAGSPAEHGVRILTGSDFLIAKPEGDKRTALQYYQFVINTKNSVEKQLLEIKTTCIPEAKLDSEYDKKTLGYVVQNSVWQGLWSALFQKDHTLYGSAPKWAKEHNVQSTAAIKGFREYYSKNCVLISIEGNPAPPYALGQDVKLKAIVKFTVPPKEPPVLRYVWSDMKGSLRFAEQSDTLKINTSVAGTFGVKIEVQKAEAGKWEKFGEATYTFTIQKASVRISADDKAVVGQIVEYKAAVDIDLSLKPSLKYAWSYEGQSNIFSNAEGFKWSLVKPETINVKLVVYQVIEGKSMLVGDAKHQMVVENPTVSMYIDGPKRTMIGQDITLTATIRSIDKKAQFAYMWYQNGQQLGSKGNTQTIQAPRQGSYTIKTEAYQAIMGKWQKVGEATYPLEVQAAYGYIYISTAKDKIKVGESTTLNGMVSETNVMNQGLFTFKWIVNGQARGAGSSFNFAGSSPGRYEVFLELWMMEQSQQVRLAQTSRFVTVEDASKKPGSDTTKKPDVPKPPPKKYEQLTDKERQNVLDCLCQCNSTAVPGAVSTYYDPKPSNSSPHCAKTSNGPCINQGFGCWRHFPINTGDCSKKCYGKYNVESVPDAAVNLGKGTDTKK
ncbi:MAG: hypothetical protein NT178_14900 [Proteobacteria bacterium]|nr:hypothetical protein [Pseudomonadota bacterium]